MHLYSLATALLSHLAENKYLLIDALLPPGYAETRLSRALFGLDDFRRRYPSPQLARRTLTTTLSRLKKEGLVAQYKTKRRNQWGITPVGQKLLHATRSNNPTYFIPCPIDHLVRLVTFDIPEQDRKKRNWLRNTLLSCGYESLHKSVFFAMRPLPEDVVKKIDELNLTRYVHIIGINKKGTLAQKLVYR